MKTKILIFLLGLSLLPVAGVFACDIKIESDKKEYQIGEIAIVKVLINWTHKNCLKPEEEPSIQAKGGEITAKTKYKEKEKNVWTISYKVKITEPQASVTVYKNCPKGGESKTYSFVVKK